MGIEQNRSNNRSNSTSNRQVDGYLNVQVVDKNNNRFNVGRSGIALNVNSPVARQMLEAAEKNPDKEFHLVGKVSLLGDEPQLDL